MLVHGFSVMSTYCIDSSNYVFLDISRKLKHNKNSLAEALCQWFFFCCLFVIFLPLYPRTRFMGSIQLHV